jgi:hypothetical protein
MGCVIGIVTQHDDDRRIARVKLRLPDVGGQKETAWARVVSPLGGIGSGAPLIPPVDAAVMVMFESGNTNHPVVLGGIWFQEAEASQLPKASLGETDDVRDARGQDTATGAQGASLQEPSDPFAPSYPDNMVFKEPKAGHLLEADGTEGKERISITHGTSKSWFEFHPDGSFVLGIKGKRYVMVDTDDQKHVKGREDVVVEGDATHKATGEFIRESNGYDLLSIGPWKVKASGAADLQALTALFKITQDMQIDVPTLTALVSTLTKIGPGTAPGAAVTTTTFPFCFVTGLPIPGTPTVLLG